MQGLSCFAGLTDSKSAAMQSKTQRRSYGAQPTSACISKSTERALMEQGRGPHSTALRGNSPDDVLDDLDYADLEEQEGNIWQEEDVWQRPSSAQQQSAMNVNQSSNQRHGSLGAAHDADAALQHSSLQRTGVREQYVGQVYALRGQIPQGQSQQDLTAQAQTQPLQHVRQLQQPSLQSQHQQAPIKQAAALENRAGDHMHASAHLGLTKPSASVTGASCQVAIHEQPGATRQCSSATQSSAEFTTLTKQQPAAEQQSIVGLNQPTSLQPDPQQNAEVAAAPVPALHTEQSDRELALRLQEEEDALRHQQQQLVPGRLLPKSSSRKPSGTIHAFFKKA